MLPGRKKVDISSFTDAERELFQKYGKVPTHKNLLSNKLKERKYFDSGDYALSKAGVPTQHSVGTAIPSPADIPHASPPTSNNGMSTSPGSGGSTQGIGIPGTSPTNVSSMGSNFGMSTSPAKEPIGN